MNTNGAAYTPSAGTSFTNRVSKTVFATNDLTTEDRVLASPGSVAATETYSAVARYAGAMVAFKPAPYKMPATAVLGQANVYSTSGTGTSATTMNTSAGVTYDSVHHRLFVADANNSRVLQSTPTIWEILSMPLRTTYSARPTSQPAPPTPPHRTNSMARIRLHMIRSMTACLSPTGGNSRVMVFNTSTITDGMNATYVLGEPNFSSSVGGTTQSTLITPYGLSYDSNTQRLFVGDTGNNRVMVFSTSSIATGMNASYVIGQSTFGTATAATTQGGLNSPGDTSYDPVSQYLYVVDGGSNRVTVYNLASIANGMNASFVLGQSTYTANGTGLTQSTLNAPAGVDATGSLIWVCDYSNNRILGFSKNGLANGNKAVMVLGQSNFTTNTSAVSQTTLAGPQLALLTRLQASCGYQIKTTTE